MEIVPHEASATSTTTTTTITPPPSMLLLNGRCDGGGTIKGITRTLKDKTKASKDSPRGEGMGEESKKCS